jgi:hypothetical protein
VDKGKGFPSWGSPHQNPVKGFGGGFFFFLTVLRLKLRVFTLRHSTSPVFVKGFFEIGFHRTICPDWL